MNNSFSEHNAILDAIFAGDEQQAEDLLKAHVVIQGQKFTDFISTIESIQPKS
jgi:DNA-binding FadR family transcriptional regulator